MAQIGIYLMIAGVGSIALNLFGYEFKLLMWIDTWGPEVGWAIRLGAIVVGAIIWFIGNKADASESAHEPSAYEPSAHESAMESETTEKSGYESRL